MGVCIGNPSFGETTKWWLKVNTLSMAVFHALLRLGSRLGLGFRGLKLKLCLERVETVDPESALNLKHQDSSE